ncbi:DedA family protein [Actinoplanes sp. CA-030573]|uniref:DedA family protein n=1 Tax=Actinoplanes sp. CA-030573 TaxID=3239898 RepID=UPI003D8FC2C0
MAPTAELPGFLGTLAPLLDRYGYLAVAGVVGVESFGIPAPGQTILITAAVYAGAGRLNILAVATIGFLAAVIGDNIGYLIGRGGGRRLILRYGSYVRLTPERFHKAEAFFTRQGPKIVIAARFIDGLRQLNGVIAGISGMSWRRFLIYNAVGAALWVGLWTTLGYVAGAHIVTVYDTIKHYQWYAVGVLAAAVAGYLGLRHLRRRRGNPVD